MSVVTSRHRSTTLFESVSYVALTVLMLAIGLAGTLFIALQVLFAVPMGVLGVAFLLVAGLAFALRGKNPRV
jgi:hypothetical protein